MNRHRSKQTFFPFPRSQLFQKQLLFIWREFVCLYLDDLGFCSFCVSIDRRQKEKKAVSIFVYEKIIKRIKEKKAEWINNRKSNLHKIIS